MAKKKKSQKPMVVRKKPKLETVFDCPFCNHQLCVEIKLDRDRRVGSLRCRICSTQHSSKIHHLSAAVDVYCAWIDECHKVNTNGGGIEKPNKKRNTRGKAADLQPVEL